ncbi:hypothetical protein CLV51_101217 [Chitinophaga niastensis]|uniref:Uncharacterized protein n=1 Tax=Chitinophaga niastensis TaxID=536980 RepID=A0A2P8HRQ8_CHINA|nr:hypothetical protein CLV51_101217 [Chitinophaga niastensis]
MAAGKEFLKTAGLMQFEAGGQLDRAESPFSQK